MKYYEVHFCINGEDYFNTFSSLVGALKMCAFLSFRGYQNHIKTIKTS